MKVIISINLQVTQILDPRKIQDFDIVSPHSAYGLLSNTIEHYSSCSDFRSIASQSDISAKSQYGAFFGLIVIGILDS